MYNNGRHKCAKKRNSLMRKDDNFNNIKDGIIGFAIGDALGVPAEFKQEKN